MEDMKDRVVEWTPEEEETLILHFIEEIEKGITVKKAMANAAGKLQGRTPDGCLFRWYTHLNKNPEIKQMFEAAKERGKVVRFRLSDKTPSFEVEQQCEQTVPTAPSLEVEQVRNFIDSVAAIKERNKELEAEKVQWQNEKAELEAQIRSLQKRNSELEADNKAYASIFEKARKYAVIEELGTDEVQKVTFKMERNGNLERQS